MKGKLIKDDEGWWVQHKAKGLDGNLEYIAESMLHPDDVEQIEKDAQVFDNIEARIAAYPDVEFKMVTEVVASVGDLDTQDYYTISYAKLINTEEQNDLEEEAVKLAELKVKLFERGYVEGYKNAKETLYTEEQVNQKMIDFAEWCRTQYKLNGETFLIEQLFSEYKSLKQPKKD